MDFSSPETPDCKDYSKERGMSGSLTVGSRGAGMQTRTVTEMVTKHTGALPKPF